MIVVACCLWDANGHSQSFSRCYDESWVTRLHAGFARNLSQPFRFVCFTDRERPLPEPIEQERIRATTLDYGCLIEPFRFGVPMILTGLDTVVTGYCGHLAEYCMEADKVALPRDPYAPHQACNGVALIPAGQQFIYRNWKGENDMKWLRQQPHAFIDDLFPGQVVSYKGHVKKNGLGDARIVYFHGLEKPGQIDEPFVKEHWR